MGFPEGFFWGAAASSYQIEGAHDADGCGRSVWDALCERPGAIHGGEHGRVACDHYHRYEQDVRLMAEIGLQAYRFSIAWPRVLPEGIGKVSEAGLGFYDRLVDRLLEAGVKPWATLFHWDYPLDLFHKGGWLHPDSPRWFADYSAAVVDRLSDRVENWMTLNEPQVFLWLGHHEGIHAPGLKYALPDVLRATHNVLLAHGLSVQTIRARAKGPVRVGPANVGITSYPAGSLPENMDAARQRMWSVEGDGGWNNSWYGDPMVFGRYPEQGLQAYGAAVPEFPAADMDTICQPLDFYGTNIYHGEPVEPGPDGQPVIARRDVGAARTDIDWFVEPAALEWGPRFLHERYKLPIVITENGMASHDWVDLDGRVRDMQRVDFLRRYLQAFERAGAAGADIEGYFLWSLMDNFEWAEGYRRRFGIIHVDFETQKRTLKESARWYARVIASHGESLHAPVGG